MALEFGTIIKSIGRGIANHPKAAIGALATAGFLSAHPFHPAWAGFQAMAFGDPNATAKMRTSLINTGLYNAIVPSNQKNMWGEITAMGGYGGDAGVGWPGPSGPLEQPENRGYYRNGPAAASISSPPPMGQSMAQPSAIYPNNPSGDLVLGLYNNRMK